MSTLHLPVATDSFNRYLAEIARFDLLSRDDEIELARRYRRRNDLEAAHRLICANLRFVVKIAREYHGYGLRLADLVQEGNIGLMLAVKKFDPERGIRLITYAVWWIRAYIQGFIIRSWSLVKIGTTQAQKKLFFKLGQAKEAIRRLTGSDAEANELADALQLSLIHISDALQVRGGEVEEMSRRMAGRDASLDVDLTEGEGFTLLDTLADERDNQETLLIRDEEEAQLGERVGQALALLNERERRIVHDRILADAPRTLQELADDYGISRERVRQLEKNALEKLKGALT